ncbi:GNAT family N-acetyltransferase [Enterobacter asburiae]|uniref:GNAT family N-acetyltransferase n=1 Tax=Scandinavium sp. UTDF21-P1B TaxID=3446379 RepID=UPI0034929530
MLTSEKLTHAEGERFSLVDNLYSHAFPWHEQREDVAKRQALAHPDYALEAWYDGDIFVGLSGTWRFGDYGYIEHLAIDDSLRGQGYGKRLLARLLARNPRTLLEIDPLTTDIAHKRLRFYQSMGFVANDYAHTHPSYHDGIADHELMVLSYPQPLAEEEYQRFRKDLRLVVMAE